MSKESRGKTDRRAAAGFTLDVQFALKPRCAQSQILQTIARMHGVSVKADAIVRDGELPKTIGSGNIDFDV
jgi:hypothetical protein